MLGTESKIQNPKSEVRWAALLLAGVAGLLSAGGCASTWTEGLRLPNVGLRPPDSDLLVRDQLVIHSDSPVPSQHRLIEELVLQRTDLQKRLGTPLSNEPIHVYLFGNEERFEKYLRIYHPLFPSRRAFFLETDTRLTVYAYWGDHVAEDLRHEVTHGYLHAACRGFRSGSTRAWPNTSKFRGALAGSTGRTSSCWRPSWPAAHGSRTSSGWSASSRRTT